METLYKEYYQYVKRICFNYLKNWQEAEDVTQDIFIKLSTVMVKCNAETELQTKAFIKRVATNHIIDQIRGTKMKFDDSSDISFVYDEEIVVEDHTILHKLISELPKLNREIIDLFFFKNMSHMEISQHLNISVVASKSRLNKTKIKLLKRKNLLYNEY